MKKKKNGFTLVELLITIAIISIVFGIAGIIITNVINSTKESSMAISKDSILNSARIYVKEYSDEISWKQLDTENERYEEKKEQKFTCVSINELINKNLLKKDIKNINNLSNYIIVWKNENDGTISEEFDDSGICGDTDMSVKIPTKKDYCQNLVYDGSTQILTKTNNEKFSFINNEGIDAGSYEVTAKLNDGYHWNDGTKDDKKISCSIKKAIPTMNIEPKIITDTPLVGEIIEVSITHEIDGKLTVKSSNNDYFEVSVDRDANIFANEPKKIFIKFLSEREINGYITITLTPTPDNAKNYYNNTETIYIGNPERKIATTPTEEYYCKYPDYDGSSQTLIKDNLIKEASNNGIILSNTKAKDIGSYVITAKLKYGYEWKDGETTNKTITCSIERPTPTVNYVNGDGCISKKVTYESTYGELCVPTKTGYTFNGWYTKDSDGTIVTKDTIVTNFNNHSIYANWTANSYKTYYDGNEYTSQTYDDNTQCNSSNECGLNRYTSGSIFENDTFKHAANHKYDTPWQLIKNRFVKTGYTFDGWSTTKDGSVIYKEQEQVKNLTATNNGTVTLYAQWSINTGTIYYYPNGGNAKSDYPLLASGTYSGASSKITNYNSSHTDVNLYNVTTLFDRTGYHVPSDAKAWRINNSTATTYMNQASQNLSSYTSASGTIVKLYANWEPNTYTIKYNANGGTGTMKDTAATYDKIQELTDNGYIKTGYTFAGWNTKADGSGTFYPNKKDVKNLTATNKGTVTLYAQWVSIKCDYNDVPWSNTVGGVNIYIAKNNNENYSGKFYYLEYSDISKSLSWDNALSSTSNPFKYSKKSITQVSVRLKYDNGKTITSEDCRTRFDNLKPYTPIALDFKKITNVNNLEEDCSKLSKTSTSSLKCNVTVTKGDSTALPVIQWSFDVDDQATTDSSDKSGVFKNDEALMKATYTYLDGHPYNGSYTCSTNSIYVDSCRNSFFKKAVYIVYDNAGNASSSLTVNFTWK